MEVKAVARYVRISPQKVRKVLGTVKGKPVGAGLDTLKFMPQKAATLLEKILRSAIANAENNNNLDIDSLIVKNIVVDQGPMLKRFRARARGRGARILKRTSHITITVADDMA
ncbi:50S ribosomal protein L22 [Desulforegula conservatrix]|uniref:50S ribosomal protein L22 n=1 Tax=Desulforegula conservatrix TaxID=153026 RepID=UPI000423610E|nr:50S ribosomal protein L22 [Desulforegula conservatrix]